MPFNSSINSSSIGQTPSLDFESPQLVSEGLLGALPLLHFEDKPFSMDEFRPLAAMFKTRPPLRSVWKTGRQCAKSTTITAFGLILAILNSGLKTMFTCPLHEQAKKFSRHRVQSIIKDTPLIQKMLEGYGTVDNWDEKILSNNSVIRIAYVLKNVMRIRGESADFLNADELQDMNDQVLDIVEACLSASKYSLIQYTGTPLTTTNILQEAWLQSSQAEWVIPCDNTGCKQWNIPSAEQHLLDMVGKEGPICAHCGKTIDPGHPKAHWKHAYPGKRHRYEGHHISHVILPIHYKLPNKWWTLRHRMQKWPEAQFYNECLGEARDVGFKRITKRDIQKACTQPKMILAEAKDLRKKCDLVVMGADWGGKGISEGVSRTAISIIGRRSTSATFETLWYKIFELSSDVGEEMEYITRAYSEFNVDWFAYDAGVDPGYEFAAHKHTSIPEDKFIPIYYTQHPEKNIMRYREEDEETPHFHYLLDRTRSLILLFEAMKRQKIALPHWSKFEEDNAYSDFLAFDEAWSGHRNPLLLLQREPGTSDDLAHAFNYALMSLLYHYDEFGSIMDEAKTDLDTILQQSALE